VSEHKLSALAQSGKSTLVRVITKDHGVEWRNLDNALTRHTALTDPTGFVDFPDLLVIDEIQRAPELLLAIKEQVDPDPRPGRYLLTGSVGCSACGRFPTRWRAGWRRLNSGHSPKARSAALATDSSMPPSRRAPGSAAQARSAGAMTNSPHHPGSLTF
jgi:hypothetical protein